MYLGLNGFKFKNRNTPSRLSSSNKSVKKSTKKIKNDRPNSSYKRNPITGKNVKFNQFRRRKNFSETRNLQENSDFSNIHKLKRKKGKFNDNNRKKQNEWKPCVKLVQSYFTNKKKDDYNIKRGLKKILNPNYKRNPILLNKENIEIKKKRKFYDFKPSSNYKKLTEKKVFCLKNRKIKQETVNYNLLTDFGFFKINKIKN